MDSGLYFDRRNANGSTQTLEPRLFYLYVPYEDQADLPQFDTAEYTFGFSQLFNTDRFTGADRQSEANQLALAISTRNYNSTTGEVLWSLNVGQIFYFQSLKIQLDDEPEISDDFSPIIAEFNWHPFTRFSARTGAQFDWDTNKLEVAGFGVSYAGKHGERVSFDYRYRRERVDQFDFRVFWPVNESSRYCPASIIPLQTMTCLKYRAASSMKAAGQLALRSMTQQASFRRSCLMYLAPVTRTTSAIPAWRWRRCCRDTAGVASPGRRFLPRFLHHGN